MDFFAHQDQARKNTGRLVFYFGLTVLIIMALVYVVVLALLASIRVGNSEPIDVFNPLILIGVFLSVGLVIASGSIYQTWLLSGDGSSVAIQLGGVKVQPNTRNLSERILLNVVEEMALASGTPVPPVYLLENEQGINAFAAGTTPQNAVVGVTRGCIETLTRDELQGVIAHEFSHILNGDMKLNVRILGMLHGILLIAMLGYSLFRIAAHMPMRSSGRNSDDSKGAIGIVAAIFIFGTLLLGIGYAGVFFAGLIQAAVSRQREFLADASAVQFTRNPLGITGALKRIGGWQKKSFVQATYAKEASHLFFSTGLASQSFATHPPLEIRIQRIEPTFNGKFEATHVQQHSESDIVDPRTLGFQRKTISTSAHVAAEAGVVHFEANPQDAVDHIGNPDDQHIEQANRLMQEIDKELIDEVHEPFGAMAIVFALLCAPQSDSVRTAQIELLSRSAPKGIAAHTSKLLPKIDALLAEQRLPLACMALPALDQLSNSQTGGFRTMVRRLIDADRRWTIFEYALQRFITRRIVLRTDDSSVPVMTNDQLENAYIQVLSTLANVGGNTHAESSFQAGWQVVGPKLFGKGKSANLVDRDECTLKKFDVSLDLLARIDVKFKRRVLDSFCTCIAHDQRSTINEVELLRVVSDALGCPMPPVLDLAPIVRS